MAKDIKFSLDSRNGLKRGVDALANAVKVTMGEKGRNVAIDKGNGKFHITKDGVTVAQEVELKDPLENMGAQMVKEVASKTNDLAGDGTTTATVLAQAIIKEGLKNIAAGANPIDLKRGIDKAVSFIVQKLEEGSQEVGSKIKQIASISANNDEVIGELIATAFVKVGKEGVITVEESKSTNTYVDIVEGMQFDKGFLSPYFVTNTEKMLSELDNPFILIYDGKIERLKDLINILEPISEMNRSLLIIAEDVDGEALSTLVLNKIKGNLKVVAVKPPEFGDRRKEMMEDIASLTGATLVSVEAGHSLEECTPQVLGIADKVVVSKDSTTIVGGKGDKTLLEERVNQLRNRINLSEDEFEKTKLKERIAKISGGVAVLYIGAASELELGEKKDRVVDALSATRAAVEEGIVPGGGVALLKARIGVKELTTNNEDEKTGLNIIYTAVEMPFKTIMENAGLDGAVIMSKLSSMKKDFGYDTRKDKYVNMIKEGIIDPKKVTRVALENAASVSSMILTTECSLVEIPENDVQLTNSLPSNSFL